VHAQQKDSGTSSTAGKRLIRVCGSQCALSGISWHASRSYWLLRYRYKAGENCARSFSPSKFKQNGKSLEDAKDRALKAAIALREKLIKKGVMKVKNMPPQRFQSHVKGVSWHTAFRGGAGTSEAQSR